ncbi:MAG TPA: beta-galactosidase [Bacillota bacterium]|nr:beta-galactosidase [Bacillota bacterium]
MEQKKLFQTPVGIPPRIFYGGDYNPEQWPESVWVEDMRLMKQAGVNLVTVGVFSWALLQSDEETYQFDWLDRLLNLLAEHGIFVDLATATAAQPAWISQKYPDILPVDVRGNTISYGSRQSYCPNSPSYRNLSQKLVRQLAQRYQNHPALLMWHINNEYGCHISTCYCENCARAFRSWLEAKYGTIEKVNEVWGTNFWSQRYYQWSEIIPPRATSTFPNPAQVLDYRRFMSDSLLECYLGEYRLLKEVTPGIPVTTNFLGLLKPLDYFKWAEYLDVISWDSYPDPEAADHAVWTALSHDLMRGLKNGQPFFLMEQAPSQVNWRPINPNKRPGVMALWSYQAIAHGADAVLFFQWRQSLKGAEKFHSAIVTHTGVDQSRIYRECAKLGNELGNLSEITGSQVPAQAAIIFDYENWWAVEYEQRPHQNLLYLDQILNYYQPLFTANIPVDVVPVNVDFSNYQLVIAPLLYLVKPGVAAALETYVNQGGTLIVTFFSGIVDQTDGIFPGGYPGPLKDLLGLKVEEFDPLDPRRTNKICLTQALEGLNNEYNCNLWCDVVQPISAKPLAQFGTDYYAGFPAVTVNQYGKGQAYYIATQPEPLFLKHFLKYVCQTCGIKPPLEAPAGVEVMTRSQSDRKYLFILNHNQQPTQIPLPEGVYEDLIAKKKYQTQLELGPNGTVILSLVK